MVGSADTSTGMPVAEARQWAVDNAHLLAGACSCAACLVGSPNTSTANSRSRCRCKCGGRCCIGEQQHTHNAHGHVLLCLGCLGYLWQHAVKKCRVVLKYSVNCVVLQCQLCYSTRTASHIHASEGCGRATQRGCGHSSRSRSQLRVAAAVLGQLAHTNKQRRVHCACECKQLRYVSVCLCPLTFCGKSVTRGASSTSGTPPAAT